MCNLIVVHEWVTVIPNKNFNSTQLIYSHLSQQIKHLVFLVSHASFEISGSIKITFYVCNVNSLWPCDAIWRQGTESTLAQVMACCLMAPSHYLNQCWLIISKVLCNSSEGIIMRRSEDTIFRIAFRSPRGQWVKPDSRMCGLSLVQRMAFCQFVPRNF